MIVYKFARLVAKPIFNIFWRVKVTGRENIPAKGRYIFCPNHITNLDPIFLAINIKRPICYMAKAELFEKGWLAPLLRAIQVFPVSRGTGDTTALDHAVEQLEKGLYVGIFPEGTRSKTGKLLPLKSGAAAVAKQSGAGIIPVGIVRNGTCGKRFRSVRIIIGKPIENADMGFSDEGSRGFRTVKKLLMEDLLELTGEERA